MAVEGGHGKVRSVLRRLIVLLLAGNIMLEGVYETERRLTLSNNVTYQKSAPDGTKTKPYYIC